MAKTIADTPHAFNEADARRIAATVRAYEHAYKNDPYQATRWPRETGSTSNRFGHLLAVLPACGGPVQVDEYVLTPPNTWTRANTTFDVIEVHGQEIDIGHWVSCIWSMAGEIWIPIAAHCTGSCITPSPPDPCAGVTCPPGYHPDPNQECACVPDDPCPGVQCPPGYHPDPNQGCLCVPDAGGCPEPAPACLPGLTAVCINGIWECVPLAPP